MLKIYHVPGTRSVRVVWLCEELGLDYEIVPVDFSTAYRLSPEWLAMNPVGKVPAMTDGTLKMFESGAMVQYLLERYGKGRLQPPASSNDYAQFLQWCWFAEATFARPLGEIVNHRRALPKEHRSEVAIAEMQDRAWLCVNALDEALVATDYLVGNTFTAADIMTGYSIMLATRLVPRELPANIKGYWDRLTSRPAWLVASAP